MKAASTYRIFFAALTLVFAQHLCLAQPGRINFGTWATTSILISDVAGSMLSFGTMYSGGQASEVNLSGATAFVITAPESYDVTVTMESPAVLTGPGSSTMPFHLRFAYSNFGLNESAARLNAVTVPDLFTSVTFPVRRNAAGLPAPPPAPGDGSGSQVILPVSDSYLYLFGTAGPAAAGTASGTYSGTVVITVEYTAN